MSEKPEDKKLNHVVRTKVPEAIWQAFERERTETFRSEAEMLRVVLIEYLRQQGYNLQAGGGVKEDPVDYKLDPADEQKVRALVRRFLAEEESSGGGAESETG